MEGRVKGEMGEVKKGDSWWTDEGKGDERPTPLYIGKRKIEMKRQMRRESERPEKEGENRVMEE